MCDNRDAQGGCRGNHALFLLDFISISYHSQPRDPQGGVFIELVGKENETAK